MIRWFLLPLSYLSRLIPKAVLRALALTIGTFVFQAIRFRRQIVIENLRLAFGKEKSEREIVKLAKSNYQHYALTFFEILQSLTWAKEDYLRNVLIEGWEHVAPFLTEGKGGFFLSCHLGNWEFAFSSAAAKGLPVDVVVKQARNATAEHFLQWYRRRTGAGILLETKTAKDILRAVNQGRFVVFVLDQFMGPPIGLPVKFFGHEAGTAAALALMTEKRDIPILTAYGYRDAKGINHTVIGPPLQFPALLSEKDQRLFEKTQCYNNALESMIRQHPEQWLWLHRRWKAYRGEPRWSLKKPVVSAFLFFLLLSFNACSSKQATPTGIALPPDPSVAVPKFKPQAQMSDDDEEGPGEAGQVTPSPTPTPTPAPAANEKTSSKVKSRRHRAHRIKKEEKLSEKAKTKQPQVASSASSNIVFNVVPADRIPFEIGERLEMDLRWMALPAGKVVMEVREGPLFDGRETYHLWGNALSSKIVDAVYHIDNTIESFVDKAALIPYKFLLHMVESKQLKETRVIFDHTKGKAYYWAKRISQRWGNMDVDRADTLVPQARDMFSALYYARALNYKLNQKQSFAIYENGQNWQVELLPIANELVTSGVGAFQCWKIQVTVSLNNVLKPTGDMYMWLSDDSKKYLVKFDAKVKIGSLYGNLVSIREH